MVRASDRDLLWQIQAAQEVVQAANWIVAPAGCLHTEAPNGRGSKFAT